MLKAGNGNVVVGKLKMEKLNKYNRKHQQQSVE